MGMLVVGTPDSLPYVRHTYEIKVEYLKLSTGLPYVSHTYYVQHTYYTEQWEPCNQLCPHISKIGTMVTPHADTKQ